MKDLKRGIIALTFILACSSFALAMDIVVWDYVTWRVDLYRQYAEEYMKENPDINIEVHFVPDGEYVTKIKVGIATGTAPTMFSGHPHWVSDFDGVLAPFPHDLFPPEQLSEQLLGYNQLLQDGQAYYYPLGMQGALLFINEDHWDNAGIGAPPRTWKEALDIGRRTTRRIGNITELAGFYFNHGNEMMHDLFIDLSYQHGGTVFVAGGTKVGFDQPEALEAVNLINDMYQSGVSGFGETLTFYGGTQVMLYSYAWRQQQITPYPNIRWTVAPLPTLTGELHPGMSRMQYYFGMAVPQTHSPEEIRAAFEFISWAYNDDDRLMDLHRRSGTLPAQMSLWSHPEIIANPVMNTLTQTLPLAITPGDFPQWIMNELGQVRSGIIAGTGDPAVLLTDVTRQINFRLAEEPLTWVVE